MKYKKKFLVFVTIVLICITAMMISNMSYSYFTTDLENSVTYKTIGKAKTDELAVGFEENREGIDLAWNMTMDGTYRYESEPYTYTVTNEEDKYITVSVFLEVTNLSTISDEAINVEADQNVQKLNSNLATSPSEEKYKSAYLVDKFNLSPSQSATRSMKVWADAMISDVDSSGQVWSSRILVVPSLNEDPAIKTLDKMNIIPNASKANVSGVSVEDEGVYSTEDDYGTSYYFRGSSTNNYVYFAGQYYRIIRINGNGTLRVIYDGTTPHSNGEISLDRVIGESPWNELPYYDDVKYAGYKFGGMNADVSTSEEQAQTNNSSSTIKKFLEEWYEINIVLKGFGGYVEDSLFCNDRSVKRDELNPDLKLGYSKNVVQFGYANRVTTDAITYTIKENPSLKCINKNDAFTVSDERHGNKSLEYPVGLISADEVSLVGGSSSTQNASYYLYKGVPYWTMSPARFDGLSAYEYVILQDGQLSAVQTGSMGIYVSPVINLSKEFIDNMKGSGTAYDPYTL